MSCPRLVLCSQSQHHYPDCLTSILKILLFLAPFHSMNLSDYDFRTNPSQSPDMGHQHLTDTIVNLMTLPPKPNMSEVKQSIKFSWKCYPRFKQRAKSGAFIWSFGGFLVGWMKRSCATQVKEKWRLGMTSEWKLWTIVNCSTKQKKKANIQIVMLTYFFSFNKNYKTCSQRTQGHFAAFSFLRHMLALPTLFPLGYLNSNCPWHIKYYSPLFVSKEFLLPWSRTAQSSSSAFIWPNGSILLLLKKVLKLTKGTEFEFA